MKRNSKKAQEEMIGFVLIIVLVAVIVLVFLGISLRQKSEVRESKEIGNFLYSSLLTSTDCKPRATEIYDFKDLIKACYNSEICIEGDSCEILEKTSKELISKGFDLSGKGKYNYYNFTIYNENVILNLVQKGNYTSSMASRIPIYVSGENIYIELKLGY